MGDNQRTSSVQVAVRVRPLLGYETEDPRNHFVLSHPSGKQVQISLGDGKTKTFTFDHVFPHMQKQGDLYASVQDMTQDLMDGYNVTFMAYGQTGSGKTFTMGSEAGKQTVQHTQGLIPRFLKDLFSRIGCAPRTTDAGEAIEWRVEVSFLEVYGNDIFDLLDTQVENHSLRRRSLPVYEEDGNVRVKGLNLHPIQSAEDALQWLASGTENRSTASTMMNQVSSRSHAIFTLTVSQLVAGEVASGAKLTFVDLAGSERLAKTQATGQRAREGIDINMGLLCLGNVINALADDAKLQKGTAATFVPYRSHKLTRLLQDALGGNSKTLFIACVSPSSLNASETYSTLHYANRARNIRNKPVRNADKVREELQRTRFAVQQLQVELAKVKFCDGDAEEASERELLKREGVVSYLETTMKDIMERFGDGDASAASNFLPHLAHADAPSGSGGGGGGPSAVVARSPVTPARGGLAGGAGAEEHDDDEEDDDDDGLEVEDEMEAIDRLWEFHQRERIFQRKDSEHSEELSSLDGEIAEKEALLTQLRSAAAAHAETKSRLQEMNRQVTFLEDEKAKLLQQMEHILSNKSGTKGGAAERTRVVSTLKNKLKSVESKLETAKSEAKSVKAATRAAERESKRARELESQILALKSSRAAAMRRQREAAAAHQRFAEESKRRLASLKRDGLKQQRQMGKLKAEAKRQRNAIGRFRDKEAKLKQQLKKAQAHVSRLVRMRAGRGAKAERGPATPERALWSDSDPTIKSVRELLRQLAAVRAEKDALTKERSETLVEYEALAQSMTEEVSGLKQLREDLEKAPDNAALREALQVAEEKVDAVGIKMDVSAAKLDDIESALERGAEDAEGSSDASARAMLESLEAPQLRSIVLLGLGDTASALARAGAAQRLRKRCEQERSELLRERDTLRATIKSSKRNFERRLTMADKDVFQATLGSPNPRRTQQSALLRRAEHAEASLEDHCRRADGLSDRLGAAQARGDALESEASALRQANALLSGERDALLSGVAPEDCGDALRQLRDAWQRLGTGTADQDAAVAAAAGATRGAVQDALRAALAEADASSEAIAAARARLSALSRFCGHGDDLGAALAAAGAAEDVADAAEAPLREERRRLEDAVAALLPHARAMHERAAAAIAEAGGLSADLGADASFGDALLRLMAKESAIVPGVDAAIDGGVALAEEALHAAEQSVQEMRVRKRLRQAELRALLVACRDKCALLAVDAPAAQALVADAEAAAAASVVAFATREDPLEVRCGLDCLPAAALLDERLRERERKRARLCETLAAAVAPAADAVREANAAFEALRAAADELSQPFPAAEGLVPPVPEAAAAAYAAEPSEERCEALFAALGAVCDAAAEAPEVLGAARAHLWRAARLPEGLEEGAAVAAEAALEGAEEAQAARRRAEGAIAAVEAEEPSWGALGAARRAAKKCGAGLWLRAGELAACAEAAEALRSCCVGLLGVKRADAAVEGALERMEEFTLATKEHRRSKIQSKKMNSTYLLEEERRRKDLQRDINRKLRRLREAIAAATAPQYLVDSAVSAVAKKLLGASHLESSTAEALSGGANKRRSSSEGSADAEPPVGSESDASPKVLAVIGDAQELPREDRRDARKPRKHRRPGNAFHMLLSIGDKDKENAA